MAALKVISVMALLLLSGTALAQTSGTVTINGTVTGGLKLSYWSGTPVGATTGSNPNPQDGALAYVMNVGNVGPINTNNYEGGTVVMAIRSSYVNDYTLSAQISANSGFGSAANGEITLADIGFGITTVVCGVPGPNCQESGTTNSFNADPLAAGKTNGVPNFTYDFGDIPVAPAPAAVILTGDRPSLRGSFSSPSNALLVTTAYAIGPQMWAATTFSATVTYTLAAP